MSTSRTIPRDEWWQRYAAWSIGEIEGPICVDCGESLPKPVDVLDMRCPACRAEQS